jgi:hypothetical protein
MSNPTEQRLRDLFAAEADAAPRAVGLAQGALRKVRRRRRILATCATGVLAVAAVTTGVLVVDGPGRPQDASVAASGDPTAVDPRPGDAPLPTDVPGPTPAGTLAGDAAAECVEAYSPEAIAGRAFAFDGTVTAIGPAGTNRPGGELDLSAVTFRVHTWFRGGSGATVTVDMDSPGLLSSAEPAVPAYGLGTRLLVSGEPRWGGAPLDAAIAWSCGFTRYHDAYTAAEWAAATD